MLCVEAKQAISIPEVDLLGPVAPVQLIRSGTAPCFFESANPEFLVDARLEIAPTFGFEEWSFQTDHLSCCLIIG